MNSGEGVSSLWRKEDWLAIWIGSGILGFAVAMAGIVGALMQGYTPPGPAGEVFRNNLRNGIDATPLCYTEVESLPPDG